MSDCVITSRQTAVLCLSILVVALCGIAYELIIGAVSSYLIGNSVYQFSLTIGLFMFAMGIGSYLSRFINRGLIRAFVIVEILVALVGGASSLILFLTFSAAPSLYQAVMILLITLVGSMVGIEIPLLTRILSSRRSFKDALAEVFSLDYLGALIGSLIFPQVLLPHLGLVSSSFAIGLLNILVALLNVWLFRHQWRRPAVILAFALLTLVALSGALLAGSLLTRYVEQKLYYDYIVYKHQSPYQKVILTKSSLNQEHRLYIDGHLQFSQRDEHRYHEALVHPVMSQNSPAKRILILGGGDGMAAREVFKWPEVECVDLVDIDPAITQVCREVEAIASLNQRALDDPRLTLYHTDAFSFVREVEEPYDRIIIDLPDPHNEVLNKLYSREFYLMLRQALKPEGAMVGQSSSPFATRKVFWCIASTLESAGWETLSFHAQIPSFGVWGFHLAVPDGKSPHLSRPYPASLRYLTPEIFQASQHFPPDMARIEQAVNSMTQPHLYQLYNQEVRSPGT